MKAIFVSCFDSAPLAPDMDMIINAVALPVELISFDAEQENTSVKLNWETASVNLTKRSLGIIKKVYSELIEIFDLVQTPVQKC